MRIWAVCEKDKLVFMDYDPVVCPVCNQPTEHKQLRRVPTILAKRVLSEEKRKGWELRRTLGSL